MPTSPAATTRFPSGPGVALPGARFELDERADRYRIARIFEGQNEEDRYRSPLTEIGVDVHGEGDYLLAIDGVELRGDDNPVPAAAAPRRRIRWSSRSTTGRTPTARARSRFVPITSESSLLYLAMVLRGTGPRSMR